MSNPSPRQRPSPRALPRLALAVLAATPAHAAINNFKALSTNYFDTAANWTDAFNTSLHAVPTLNDYAYFDSADTTVSLRQNNFARGLEVLTGTTLYVNGVNGTSPALTLGSGGISLANGCLLDCFGNPTIQLSAAQSWSTSGAAVISVPTTNNNGFDLTLNNSSGGIVYLGLTSNGSAGGLSGTGGLYANGGTTHIVTNGNFSGPTTIAAGTLNLAVVSALASTSAITFSGGTLKYTTDRSDHSSRIVNSTSPITLDTANATITFASPLDSSNIGGLSKTGSGTLITTADNTYSGPTVINAGTLQLGTGGTTGSVPGNIANNANLILHRSDDLNYAGVISGTGTLQKLGANTLTLTGNNTASGQLTVSAGTLKLGGGAGGSAAGSWSGNIALAADTTLILNRSNTYDIIGVLSGVPGTTGSITKLGTGTTRILTYASPSTYTGPIRILEGTLHIESSTSSPLAASAIVNDSSLIIRHTPVSTATFGGSISGTGTFQKTGGGMLILTGNTTLTGLTTHAEGVLQFGNGGTSGGITGDILNNASLVFSRANDLTYSGTLTGTGTLTKLGTGRLTLTADNPFTGTTTLTAGTLELSGAAGNLGGPITNNAALVFNRASDLTYVGTISGTGTLTKLGAGKLALTANSTYINTTTISAGTLELGNGGTTGLITGPITNNAALIFNRSSNATYASTVSGTGSLTKTGTGTLTLTGGNTYTGPTNFNQGTVVFSGSGDTSTASLHTIGSGALLRLARNDTWGLHTTTTTAPLDILAGGTVTSTNTHTPLVNLNLSGGTLRLNGGLGTTFGAFSLRGTVTVAGTQPSQIIATTGNFNFIGIGPSESSGALTFDVADVTATQDTDLTVAVPLANQRNNANNGYQSSSLVKTGTGTLLLTGISTYSGGTTLLGGTLAVSADNNLGAASGHIVSGVGGAGTLRILGNAFKTTARTFDWGGFGGALDIADANNTFTLSQPFSYYLSKTGPGTLVLTGTSSLSGLAIDEGTLAVGNGGTTGSVSGPITNNAALIINRSNTLTLPSRLTGTGTLTKSGAGTLVLAPNQTLPHVQGTLSIAGGGIDLTNNDLILTNQSESSIRDLLATWWNNGARNGTGLISSLATTDNLTTLAVTTAGALNTSTYNTVSGLSPTALIIKYTYLGDTNLDGIVNSTDLTNLMKGIRSSGSLTGWANGDTNYDGLINALDYANLVTSLRFQGAPLDIVDTTPTAPTTSGQIPEPSAALALLPVVALMACRRRRAAGK